MSDDKFSVFTLSYLNLSAFRNRKCDIINIYRDSNVFSRLLSPGTKDATV